MKFFYAPKEVGYEMHMCVCVCVSLSLKTPIYQQAI